MTHRTKFIGVLAVGLLLGGCGGNSEKLATDFTGEIKGLTAILETIKDDETARSAAKKIEEATPRIVALLEKLQKTPDPPKDVTDRLKKEMETAGTEMGKKYQSILMTKPSAGRIIEPAMTTLSQKIMALKKK